MSDFNDDLYKKINKFNDELFDNVFQNSCFSSCNFFDNDHCDNNKRVAPFTYKKPITQKKYIKKYLPKGDN